jgi:hypothetical protein
VTVVHAGAVGWRGHAILVPGRSGTGKSSLVGALVRAGAVHYCDDLAAIDAVGLVHPHARERRPRPPLPVAMVVNTAFQEGAEWRPRVVRGASAALSLLDNVITTSEQPQRALATAAMIAAGAVTLAGARPEAGEIAGPLLARLDEILDRGRAPVTVHGRDAPGRVGSEPGVPADVARRLRVDALTGEVLAALAEADVHPILLGGPATVRWLYPDDPEDRSYGGADLLVAPADHAAACGVLTARGFVPAPDLRPQLDRRQAVSFVREADGAVVDLHQGLQGAVPQQVWAAARRDAESMTVAGATVAVLGAAMRLLEVVLSLGPHDGPGDGAWIDLSRALDVAPREEWEASVECAEQLGVTRELAARLHRHPYASWLLEMLGPQAPAKRSRPGLGASDRRAIVCFVEGRGALLQQALALRESVLFAGCPDTDLVVMAPAEVLDALPDDVVAIEQRVVADDPEWRGYRYANDIAAFNGAGADLLDRYTHLLRTDVDTFVTPAWRDFRPTGFVCGNGGYAHDDDVRARLRAIASELGLTHRGMTNLGSTWYGPTPLVRRIAALTEMLTRYILSRHFQAGPGQWPGWYSSVSLLYGAEIAINHFAPEAVTSRLLDHSSTADVPLDDGVHIHCWHTDEKFSKFWFMDGRHDGVEPGDIGRIPDYCLEMAMRARTPTPARLLPPTR